jgi:hypothetical protein
MGATEQKKCDASQPVKRFMIKRSKFPNRRTCCHEPSDEATYAMTGQPPAAAREA